MYKNRIQITTNLKNTSWRHLVQRNDFKTVTRTKSPKVNAWHREYNEHGCQAVRIWTDFMCEISRWWCKDRAERGTREMIVHFHNSGQNRKKIAPSKFKELGILFFMSHGFEESSARNNFYNRCFVQFNSDCILLETWKHNLTSVMQHIWCKNMPKTCFCFILKYPSHVCFYPSEK